MNNKYFFDSIRESLFNGKLGKSQVDGINTILDVIAKSSVSDKRWIAYIFATIFHETGQTMQPIEEYGKGKKYAYGKKVKRSRVPYQTPDHVYYGRGFVQLTWYENYEQIGRLLHVDLLNQPELALDITVASKILIEGMTKGNSHFGDFTGVSLENYFNDTKTDWKNARKIINGLDKADLIAEYAQKFHKALEV